MQNSTISPYRSGLNGVNQKMNLELGGALWWSLGCIACIVLIIRVVGTLWVSIRQISTMTRLRFKEMPNYDHQDQAYWKRSQWSWMPPLKKHLLYAPLWKKRHHQNIQMLSAVSVGTLPSRLQTLIIALYVGSNTAYMCILDWNVPNRYALCAELRGRAGTLATANLLPLIIMASRNNPLTRLLAINSDSYNLLHRWIGRLVVAEVLVHAIAWAIPSTAETGWGKLGEEAFRGVFLATGSIGAIAMLLIFVSGASLIRKAFYETFLVAHIVLALMAVACTWIHCATADLPAVLPQLPWIGAVAAMWLCERLIRVVRLVLVNWRSGQLTIASCELLPGEAIKVTAQLPRCLRVRPGSHAYLRIRSLRVWESHPFSIAWVENHAKSSSPACHVESSNDGQCRLTTNVTFIIGARNGMTRQLYEKVLKSKLPTPLTVGLEGPYNNTCTLDSYGHIVLVAGSTGITYQLSYIRHLMNGYGDGTVSARRILLIWAIRKQECFEWIKPFMPDLLRVPDCGEILRIKVFTTRETRERAVSPPKSTTGISFYKGRPDVLSILKGEVQRQIGAMCVTVCGPGALADEVRQAVRIMQGQTVIDFCDESFTW